MKCIYTYRMFIVLTTPLTLSHAPSTHVTLSSELPFFFHDYLVLLSILWSNELP